MAKRKKSKSTGMKGQKRLGRRTPRRSSRIRADTPGATGLNIVTPEQLEAILKVLNMLIDHADRVASNAQVGVVAARDLLVGKGLVTEAEWDAAVDRVERAQAMLFALDPDVRRAVGEVRRLLDLGEPDGDAPDEGGEA